MVSTTRNVLPGTRRYPAALTVLALLGCEQIVEEPEQIIRPVRYAVVETAGSLVLRTYSGTVRAELEADLSFRVSGRLISRLVNNGDSVSSGTLIGELDPTDYEIRVQEAEAGLLQAQAALRNAESNFERTRALFEADNAPQSDYDAARATEESARALVGAATQQLEAARLQRAYTRLESPDQCDIAQVFVEQNQNVTAGQPIVRVNCGQCSEVVVSVPGVDIGNIVLGAPVSVMVEALQGRELMAVVSEVGVATGGSGATYPVTVALQEGCADLRSGMAADVEFQLRSTGPEGALIVPFVSVGGDRTGGEYVFVLEQTDNNTWVARRRTVTSAEPTQNGLRIESGLEEGELIATAGVRRLVDGLEVTLLEESVQP